MHSVERPRLWRDGLFVAQVVSIMVAMGVAVVIANEG